jgi:hypothetical protein
VSRSVQNFTGTALPCCAEGSQNGEGKDDDDDDDDDEILKRVW